MEYPATMLQFDWNEVDGEMLTAVMARGIMAMNTGQLHCDEIALVVGAQAVVLRTLSETAELIVTLEAFGSPDSEWQPLAPLAELVSHRIGWCWVGRNYRGYLDQFTIALDGIDPDYAFVGMGTGIWCMRMSAVMRYGDSARNSAR